ncbi:MAG: AAA family ATPase [Candidatus Adiutrix sp.]|jgi:putative DNA primase/helicase|nr:AAA family ATPase [Candidatus Adiutrix sp.]
MNFAEINQAALASEYPRYLFPKANQAGRELQCGDIYGSEGRSFNLNLDSGAWIDNSTGQKGGDFISLVAEREGLTQGEAARKIQAGLSMAPAPAPKPAPRPSERDDRPEAPTTGEPAHTYPYHNGDGSLAFEVLRYEKPGHKKAIRAKGAYNPKLLYNAAVALTYNPIFIVEGEACVEALRPAKIGLPNAVCNPGGAGKWRDEHSQALKGKDVVIFPDNDQPGRDHAAKVAASVYPYAASVKILDLPGLPPKGDVVDWLAAGGTSSQLRALMEAAPLYQPPQEIPKEAPLSPKASRLVVMGVRSFLSEEIPPRDYILNPVIPEQGLVMLYAARGVGKTFIALSISVAVASGGPLFAWKAERPRRTIYFDGEMPARTMQDRIRAIEAGAGCQIDDDFLQIMTPDKQADRIMPNLSTPEGQAELAEIVSGFDFIVIDNLATLCRGRKENEAESWGQMQEWLLTLRRAGKSVLLVHHAGKTGDQRGSSAKEDILDTVIKLSRSNEYMADQGAKFDLELTKARGITGPDAEPFEATLTQSYFKSEGLAWEYSRKADRDKRRVQELLNEELTQRQIADIMGEGWNLTRVNRFIHKHSLKKKGLVS